MAWIFRGDLECGALPPLSGPLITPQDASLDKSKCEEKRSSPEQAGRYWTLSTLPFCFCRSWNTSPGDIPELSKQADQPAAKQAARLEPRAPPRPATARSSSSYARIAGCRYKSRLAGGPREA